MKRIRCAIYTRKSHERGLDQEFNSLDQQREAADAYIKSMASEGWAALENRYDDAAISGATMGRPALARLLTDIERGRIDVVVVYKIDRLSRSLRDFVQLMDLFEQHGASFVSVTQRFDTSTSMGKLTLNVLMSFAEFEREVTRERILDKIAAHKRRGKHTGGMPVLGYDTDRAAKKLVLNEKEARLVRKVFRRFTELRSASKVAVELNRLGHVTKKWTSLKGKVFGGRPWTKRHVYDCLNNRKYLGEVPHRGEVYPGEHEAIVTQKLWDEAHRVLAENHTAAESETRAATPALLRGLIKCATCGSSMGPTYSRKDGRVYRYYLCVSASKRGYSSCPVRTVAAGEVEAAVVDQLRAVFRSPEIVARTYREAKAREGEETDRLRAEKTELENRLGELKKQAETLISAGGGDHIGGELRSAGDEIDELKSRLETVTSDIRALESIALTEREVIDALERLDPVWNELFPAEQARIVGLLVERVDVHPDGLELRIRADGLRSLVAEISGDGEARAG
ncbi:MAG: recombinase family protein [Armatimonadetes bacterium]|nr:recombinase family protein [Armatimonadota bacterium]